MSSNPYESPRADDPPPRLEVPLNAVLNSRLAAIGRGWFGVIGMLLLVVALGFLNLFFPRPEKLIGVWYFGVVLVLMLLLFIASCAFGYWLWRRQVYPELNHLSALIADGTATAEVFQRRGELYQFEMVDAERAIDDFGQAIERQPDVWRFYALRAKAHYQQKNYPEAAADATQAIGGLVAQGQPSVDHWWVFDLRSRAAYKTEDYGTVVADATEVLELFPEALGRSNLPRRLLAGMFFVDNEFVCRHRGTEFPPPTKAVLALAYYRRAVSLRHLGNDAEARRDFAQAHYWDRCFLLEPRALFRRPAKVLMAILCVALWGLLAFGMVLLEHYQLPPVFFAR